MKLFLMETTNGCYCKWYNIQRMNMKVRPGLLKRWYAERQEMQRKSVTVETTKLKEHIGIKDN